MISKRAVLVCAAVSSMSLGSAPAALAASPAELLGPAFGQICLASLPDFSGAGAILEAQGYTLTPYGDNEFEFAHPSNGIWGAFGAESGCTVAHEAVTKDQARQLGAGLLKNALGAEPAQWSYEGTPSGWTVPLGAKTLYVIFNDGGLSAEMRAE